MMVGIIGTVVNAAGERLIVMAKSRKKFTPKKKEKVNIFNSPMDLRDWAVTLIGYLGDSKRNILPNTEKVDGLIGQFVSDYNFYYNQLQEQLAEEEKQEEE